MMTEGNATADREDAGVREIQLRDTRVRELAFLHEIAQLATQARDWDELMRSIVDGTTAAMGVEVCSFYLADHEHSRLTLAATNGLDRSQVGKVSLAWGEGITGRVAASRQPIAVEDVTQDENGELARRQRLQTGDERQGDRLGLLVAGFRPERRLAHGFEQAVGIRL